MNKNNVRFVNIDFLRAICIVLIIIIHHFAYYLKNAFIFNIWNLMHFVVPGFVFASGYLLQSKKELKKSPIIFFWLIKRLKRLLLPYYFYLFFHYFLITFFPILFKGINLKKDLNFFLESIILVGGVDLNWFVFLFVQLTMITPFIIITFKKKILEKTLFLISFLFSLYFYFFKGSYPNYKLLMFSSWLFIFYLGIFAFRLDKKQSKKDLIKKLNYLKFCLFFAFLFVIFLLFKKDSKFVLTNNKYPPNIFYLSYGISFTYFFLIIGSFKFFQKEIIRRIIEFLSKNSYFLFFIHFIILDFILSLSDIFLFLKKNIYLQLIFILAISLMSVYFIELINSYLKMRLFKKFIFLIVGFLVILTAINFIVSYYYLEKNNFYAKPAIIEWLQKPAGVRFVGRYDRTYLAWIDHLGKIKIRYFDHHKNLFSKTIEVDDLKKDFGIEAVDDHNAPSILILPDGHIILFYVVHDVKNAFFYKKSLEKENINFWSERFTLIKNNDENDFYNYPQPRFLSNGKLLVFYRKGTFYNSKQFYKFSLDHGKSWSNEIKLIDFGQTGIYAFSHIENNSIFIAWNKGGFKPPKFNAYFAQSFDGGLTWQNINKETLSLPIVEENKTLIFNSQKQPLYIWDITVDKKKQPLIFYTFKNDPNHQLKVFRWNGDFWTDELVTGSKLLYNGDHFFSGGGSFDYNNPNRLVVSKQRKKLEIEIYEYDSNKKNWFLESKITRDSIEDNFRPQFIKNYHQNFPLIWAFGKYEGLINGQWIGYNKVGLKYQKK